MGASSSFNTLGGSSLVITRASPQNGSHYIMFKQGVPLMFSCRYYSTSNSDSELRDLPSPLLTIKAPTYTSYAGARK